MIIQYHIICQISTALCKNSKKHFFASIFDFPPFCLLYSNRLSVAAPLPPRRILYILPSFLKISRVAAPKLPQLKPHIYCVYFICAVSVGAGSRAHRAWISAYIGQFYRRAIFVLFCIFPCSLSPARPQGRSLCEHTANSGAKVWYTARFCAILDKKSTQPGRARHKRGHT